MKIEYIGKLLPDGHISVDPSVLTKLKTGEKLRISIEPLTTHSNEKQGMHQLDPATQRILSRLKAAPKLGRITGELRREDLYEEMSDEHF